jgi:hypothetical protein
MDAAMSRPPWHSSGHAPLGLSKGSKPRPAQRKGNALPSAATTMSALREARKSEQQQRLEDDLSAQLRELEGKA